MRGDQGSQQDGRNPGFPPSNNERLSELSQNQISTQSHSIVSYHKQTHNTNFHIMRLLTHNFLKSNVKGYVLKRIVYTWCGWSTGTGLFRRERLFI